MTVETKICGLSTPETVDVAVRHGARFVGFVTYPRSPRHISTETMRALGANHLVIGRPITEAADPNSAAQAIARDLEAL